MSITSQTNLTTVAPEVAAPEGAPESAGGESSEPADPQNRHFSTDHLLHDLKGRSVRGGAVTLAAQAVKFALQMGSTMVLARLLTPADFGLIAMVTAVTGFVAMFKDAGLSMATIQREHITHAQVSTLFWINVALSVGVMLVVAALAPAIAWFYGDPRLTGITLALAATFIFGGLTVQHQALLRRQMRFRALATIDICSMAAGVATAIAMAFADFGYWSLVGLTAGTTIANCALVWIASGWRPGRAVRGSGVRPMLAFGGNLTGANVLAYLRRNLDNILIGAVWGASSLGLYAKAYQLLLLPVRQINAPLTAVAVPALSRLQDKPEEYRRFYRRFIECIATAGFPLMLFAIIKAEAVVLALLGEQWSAAVPLLIALAPAAVVGVLNVAGGVVFLSMGRTDRQLRTTIVTAVIVAAGFVAGLPFGPLGVAIGFSATFATTFPGIVWYAFLDSPLRGRDVFVGLWRPIVASTAASTIAVAVGWAGVSSWDNPFAEIAVSLAAFSATYALVSILLPGGKDFIVRLSQMLLNRRQPELSVAEGTDS